MTDARLRECIRAAAKEIVAEWVTAHVGDFAVPRDEVLESIAEIMARHLTRPPGGAWRSIETCPNGEQVLVFGGRFEEVTAVIANGDWWRMATRDGRKFPPTHWQPLPEPPR